MARELTLAMIKPDAIQAKKSGKIISMIEDAGFEILYQEKGLISKEVAEAFYDVHKDKPFFNELVDFISSGPVIVMALEKENAIQDWRDLMGATNPEDAEEGTIRELYGTSIGHNAAHGSDSAETAMYELSIFFPFLFDGLEEKVSKEEGKADA